MDQNTLKPMTPFDCLVTPDELYMLKLLLPYTPANMQRFLAIFIKFLELRHTMEYFKGFPSCSSDNLIHDLKPYMSKSEQGTMEQMESMMHMMDMVQNMQSMPDDQADMFSMFSNMFGADMDGFHDTENKET